ncbi:MAG: hypothetical protein H7Z37_18975 [Pyrinomonadaceae bacterium]|nr:hypothetical protein [Pyrinomonadaceae bacterium]
MNDNKNGFKLSGSDLKILHKHLNLELHDLNGDGISEYFLYIQHSDWCGAGSNCTYWVYQKTAKGYVLLIEHSVLRVKETVTNGYRDLSSETPEGFCELYVQRVLATPYKFDGKKYVAEKTRVECHPYTLKK